MAYPLFHDGACPSVRCSASAIRGDALRNPIGFRGKCGVRSLSREKELCIGNGVQAPERCGAWRASVSECEIIHH